MTTSQENKQRREERVELEATILIEIIAARSSQPGDVIMCHSLDLSRSGLQVVLDEDMDIGSIFRLCVDLPDAEPIYLVAEVKWRRPDAETDAWRIGFALFESDGTDIDRWKDTVETLIAA